MWQKLLALAVGLFFMWMLYKYISTDKQAFTKETFSKSAKTLGLLALGLIAFITFCILMLRS